MALMSIHRTTDSLYQPHSIQTTFIASLVIWRQTAAILASSARASPCRRARRGATQPASARMRTPARSSADGLFQPEVEALSRHPRGPTSFTIGCVNFGFQQSMMEGKRQCTYNLGCEAVCTKIVYDGDCDILFGCEVGAYGKGLAAANIELDDILRNPFGERVCCDWAQNYVTAWNFFGARHDNMTKRRESQIHTVPGTRNVRATVSRFDVKKDKHDTVHVISGNMHIVCATKAPSLQARRKAVKALADYLDSFVPDSDMPVARAVRGVNNFVADEVRQALRLVTRNELAWTGAQPRRCPTPQCGAMSWRERLGPHLEEGRAKVLRVASDTLANGDPRPAADALEAGAAANPGAPGALSAAPFVFDTQLPGILRWLEPPWKRRPFFCPSCFADTDSPFGYSCRLCLDISEPCMVARRWRMAVWQIRTS